MIKQNLRSQRDVIGTAFDNIDTRLETDEYLSTEEEWRKFVDLGVLIEKAVEILRQRYRSPKPPFEYSPPERSPYSIEISPLKVVSPPRSPPERKSKRNRDLGDETHLNNSTNTAGIGNVPTNTNPVGNQSSNTNLIGNVDKSKARRKNDRYAVKLDSLKEIEEPRTPSNNGDFNLNGHVKNSSTSNFNSSKLFSENREKKKYTFVNEEEQDNSDKSVPRRKSFLETLKNAANKKIGRGSEKETKSEKVLRRNRPLSSYDNQRLISSENNSSYKSKDRFTTDNFSSSRKSNMNTSYDSKNEDSIKSKKIGISSSFHEYNPSNRIPLKERLRRKQLQSEQEQQSETERKTSSRFSRFSNQNESSSDYDSDSRRRRARLRNGGDISDDTLSNTSGISNSSTISHKSHNRKEGGSQKFSAPEKEKKDGESMHSIRRRKSRPWSDEIVESTANTESYDKSVDSSSEKSNSSLLDKDVEMSKRTSNNSDVYKSRRQNSFENYNDTHAKEYKNHRLNSKMNSFDESFEEVRKNTSVDFTRIEMILESLYVPVKEDNIFPISKSKRGSLLLDFKTPQNSFDEIESIISTPGRFSDASLSESWYEKLSYLNPRLCSEDDIIPSTTKHDCTFNEEHFERVSNLSPIRYPSFEKEDDIVRLDRRDSENLRHVYKILQNAKELEELLKQEHHKDQKQNSDKEKVCIMKNMHKQEDTNSSQITILNSNIAKPLKDDNQDINISNKKDEAHYNLRNEKSFSNNLETILSIDEQQRQKLVKPESDNREGFPNHISHNQRNENEVQISKTLNISSTTNREQLQEEKPSITTSIDVSQMTSNIGAQNHTKTMSLELDKDKKKENYLIDSLESMTESNHLKEKSWLENTEKAGNIVSDIDTHNITSEANIQPVSSENSVTAVIGTPATFLVSSDTNSIKPVFEKKNKQSFEKFKNKKAPVKEDSFDEVVINAQNGQMENDNTKMSGNDNSLFLRLHLLDDPVEEKIESIKILNSTLNEFNELSASLDFQLEQLELLEPEICAPVRNMFGLDSVDQDIVLKDSSNTKDSISQYNSSYCNSAFHSDIVLPYTSEQVNDLNNTYTKPIENTNQNNLTYENDVASNSFSGSNVLNNLGYKEYNTTNNQENKFENKMEEESQQISSRETEISKTGTDNEVEVNALLGSQKVENMNEKEMYKSISLSIDDKGKCNIEKQDDNKINEEETRLAFQPFQLSFKKENSYSDGNEETDERRKKFSLSNSFDSLSKSANFNSVFHTSKIQASSMSSLVNSDPKQLQSIGGNIVSMSSTSMPLSLKSLESLSKEAKESTPSKFSYTKDKKDSHLKKLNSFPLFKDFNSNDKDSNVSNSDNKYIISSTIQLEKDEKTGEFLSENKQDSSQDCNYNMNVVESSYQAKQGSGSNLKSFDLEAKKATSEQISTSESKGAALYEDDLLRTHNGKRRPLLTSQMSIKEYRRKKLEQQRSSDTSESNLSEDDRIPERQSSQADVSDLSSDDKERQKRYSRSKKDLRALTSDWSSSESEHVDKNKTPTNTLPGAFYRARSFDSYKRDFNGSLSDPVERYKFSSSTSATRQYMELSRNYKKSRTLYRSHDF